MEHVFISYSREDTEYVALLVEELRENSHDVWLDTSDISGGTNWAEEIEKAISSSYALIVIVSKDSKKSEWVKKEIELAKKANKKFPIIPVLIDKSTLPRILARNQTIDFTRMFEGNAVNSIRNYRIGIRKLLETLELARPMLRLLKELRSSNDEKRERAARMLGDLGDRGAAVQLIDALKDLDSDVRYEAALSLGKLKIHNAFKPLIRVLMEDEEPDVCAAAATALGELKLKEAISSLGLKLKDSDRFVRAAAVRALGSLGDVSAINELVELLRTDSISDVRDAAREALENIGGRQAERALRRIDQSRLLGKKGKKEEEE